MLAPETILVETGRFMKEYHCLIGSKNHGWLVIDRHGRHPISSIEGFEKHMKTHGTKGIKENELIGKKFTFGGGEKDEEQDQS